MTSVLIPFISLVQIQKESPLSIEITSQGRTCGAHADRRYFVNEKNAACQQQGENLSLDKVPLL